MEGCKHSLEVTIPVDVIEGETVKVVEDIKKRARLPGFRPGKAPGTLIKKQFQGDIRQKVLESLIPKYFDREVKQEHLKPVSAPDITEVHFDEGEPLRFKAEFEVEPEFEIGEYRGLSVSYHEPEVTDEDVAKRLEEIRNDKATFVNEEPRPLADGDHAVLSLESVSGPDEPVKSDELTLEIGAPGTLEAFTENLRGMSPGEEKDFPVTYPEDFGQEKLAGKTVLFHCVVKGVRRKELPEVNDEFAQDLGDYRTLDELKESIRKGIFSHRQFEAQQAAKNKLVETLVDRNDFPVPEAYVERQIRNKVEQRLSSLSQEGVDTSKLKLDWEKVKEAQRDQALREVRASLLLSKISEREAIAAMRDEVDREVERIARQRREPLAAARARMEKEGMTGRIASHIQTEKTLNFLFEQAAKTAGELAQESMPPVLEGTPA
ncbi:MAG: trigger factor [Bryobacteraceae bacterium]